ncbi:uncharacterized protein B0I36DRAFT_349505 [Microdochium trichocladiopsis]|uniref:Uncharacterized protein n=1 Tax=Microdochium trichocladiopsis TaxID=1682393 RepID=A0A9P9BR01_9PEZI|nr:uncharacterized protein B0I36DRAFT_349505 [Microdochium trichocladiopsis]KAH7031427.1 hypothetical protein B0I36DRAFT_349505 [Microdochium trichocladiopsis]
MASNPREIRSLRLALENLTLALSSQLVTSRSQVLKGRGLLLMHDFFNHGAPVNHAEEFPLLPVHFALELILALQEIALGSWPGEPPEASITRRLSGVAFSKLVARKPDNFTRQEAHYTLLQSRIFANDGQFGMSLSVVDGIFKEMDQVFGERKRLDANLGDLRELGPSKGLSSPLDVRPCLGRNAVTPSRAQSAAARARH